MLLLLNRIILVVFIFLFSFSTSSEEVKSEFIKTKWSFEGIFGTFDRASLQRGYQVYQEVCSGCHSVQHLSLGVELNDSQNKLLDKLGNLFGAKHDQKFQKFLQNSIWSL